MKMRKHRKMRTVPREYSFHASVRCEPYEVQIGSLIVPMHTKRICIKFKMQSASQIDFVRQIQDCGAYSATIRR